ncbi:MAG TPA: hypothetical protein VMR50_08470 [Myxococcota bacterium]|nr:hypothetical protein [Myxococcota bacterium]
MSELEDAGSIGTEEASQRLQRNVDLGVHLFEGHSCEACREVGKQALEGVRSLHLARIRWRARPGIADATFRARS